MVKKNFNWLFDTIFKSSIIKLKVSENWFNILIFKKIRVPERKPCGDQGPWGRRGSGWSRMQEVISPLICHVVERHLFICISCLEVWVEHMGAEFRFWRMDVTRPMLSSASHAPFAFTYLPSISFLFLPHVLHLILSWEKNKLSQFQS